MIFNVLVTCVLFLLTPIIILFFYQKFSKYFRFINRIPGPPGMPIIGNALLFLRSREQIYSDERQRAITYFPTYKYWVFNVVAVSVLDPDDVEIVLSSVKHMKKSRLYDCLHPWLGTGLLTSDGKKWQMRRKLLTPAFHFSILPEFVSIFNSCTQELSRNLEKLSSEPYINVVPLVTELTLKTITESAMGTKLTDSQSSKRYKKAVEAFADLAVRRMCKPWLYRNSVYNVTRDGLHSQKVVNTLHDFTNTIIAERKKNKNGTAMTYSVQKKLAMLDLLIEGQKNGDNIDDSGLREEVDTFTFEGHDTTAIAICTIMLILANEGKSQSEIRQEIIDTLGDDPDCFPSYNDLQKLTYTERCIKECLRLYPSVPGIARYAGEDIKTKTGYTIPKDCMIHVHIFDIHRNPQIYPNPEKFDPDRFLPENLKTRHPFAYIPFSAGPRNCIGQKFAMLEIKSVLCGILRKFILKPVDKPSDIVFAFDLVLRTTSGIKVKFTPIR